MNYSLSPLSHCSPKRLLSFVKRNKILKSPLPKRKVVVNPFTQRNSYASKYEEWEYDRSINKDNSIHVLEKELYLEHQNTTLHQMKMDRVLPTWRQLAWDNMNYRKSLYSKTLHVKVTPHRQSVANLKKDDSAERKLGILTTQTKFHKKVKSIIPISTVIGLLHGKTQEQSTTFYRSHSVCNSFKQLFKHEKAFEISKEDSTNLWKKGLLITPLYHEQAKHR